MPRCLTCGYDLRGVAAPVCPECGGDVTADESRRARLAHLALTIIVWTVPFWTAASMTSLPTDFGWTTPAIRTILGLVFAAAVLLFAWVSPSSRRIRRVSYAAGLFLAVSVALSLAINLIPVPGEPMRGYYAQIIAGWLIWAAQIATAALALVMCGDLLIDHRLNRLGHRLRLLAWISAAAALAAPLIAYAARYSVNAAVQAEYARLNPAPPPDPNAAPNPLGMILGNTPPFQPAPEPAWWSIAFTLLQTYDIIIYAVGALLLTAAWTVVVAVRTITRPSPD